MGGGGGVFLEKTSDNEREGEAGNWGQGGGGREGGLDSPEK